MKRTHIVWAITGIIFTLSGLTAYTAEKLNFKLFGIEAEIKKSNDHSYYIVKTKGKKENEGFVFTPAGISGGEGILFAIELKGKGKVFLKVEETDVRGAYIKESMAKPTLLTEDWEPVRINSQISSKTVEVDVMVLTSNKGITEFAFKNMLINQY